MKNLTCRTLRLVASLVILIGLAGAGGAIASPQASKSDDEKYIGTWSGTWTGEDGSTGSVTITLSKDEKAQWHGTIKYTVEGEERTADFRTLSFADGKLKGKLDSPDGQGEITLEGEFGETEASGMFAIGAKDSTEPPEVQGHWKVMKKASDN
jgi:hypothetical protein